MVFLLMIGCRGWSFGKWVSISFRNFAPNLVLISAEKEGVKPQDVQSSISFFGWVVGNLGVKL